MVSAALLLRASYILLTHCYRFPIGHWRVFESCEIAYSLASGSGYTLLPGGGPTAWLAPAYPWLIAASFLRFGIDSPTSAFAVLIFNSIFAALTAWTVYAIALRLFNRTVAIWSGWIWVLLPTSVYYSAYWLWDTTLSAFLLSAAFLMTLCLRGDDRLLRWCAYGLLWGAIGLTNPTILIWLPFAGSWLLFDLVRQRKHYIAPVLLGASMFWIALSPWLLRNDRVFDEPLLLRSAFGPNLRSGNNPEAQGWWVVSYTYNNPVLLKQYMRLGELPYVSLQGRIGRKWILAYPRRFAVLCLRRFVFFWIGFPGRGVDAVKSAMLLVATLLSFGGVWLALKRHVPGAALFAALLVLYPAIYYITFPQARYRHVIEPELMMLAVFSAYTLVSIAFARWQHKSGPERSMAAVAS